MWNNETLALETAYGDTNQVRWMCYLKKVMVQSSRDFWTLTLETHYKLLIGSIGAVMADGYPQQVIIEKSSKEAVKLGDDTSTGRGIAGGVWNLLM